MKSIVSGLFALLCFQSIAQNWEPFSSHQKGVYVSLDNQSVPEPAIAFTPGELVGLDIDSIGISGNDSLLYNYFVVGCDITDPLSPCNNQDMNCSDHFSWIGMPHVKGANESFSVNRWHDTVFMPSVLSDTGTLWASSDSILMCVKTEMRDTIIHGVADSVTEFRLFFAIGGNIDTQSDWHNQVVLLSKHYGFLETPVWYLVPMHPVRLQKTDWGLNGQLALPGATNIQGYQPGDIIEFRQSAESGKSPYSGSSYRDSFKSTRNVCTVSGIDTASNGTVSYTLDCDAETTTRIYEDLSYTSLLISTEVTVQSLQRKWPGYAIGVNSLKSSSFGYTSNGQITFGLDVFSLFPVVSNSECPYLQEKNTFEPSYSHNEKTIVGIGKVFEQDVSVTWGGLYNAWSVSEWELTYFKSGSITYGSRGWPIGIKEGLTGNPARVFPNPFRDLVHIRGEQITSVIIHNQVGQQVFCTTGLMNATESLDLSTLPPGVYYMTLDGESGRSVEQLIKE